MRFPRQIRRSQVVTLCAIIVAVAPAFAQEKPRPQAVVDLKLLGIAPDLFTDQSDSMYSQRGVLTVFWVGSNRIAAAFSTNRRWSESEEPEPLDVRVLIFDPAGKQLNSREWKLPAEGPAAQSGLEFGPGPGDSILAVHPSNSTGKIPDGDLIQVLNADTSLRENFYVPATSVWLPGVISDASLVLETFYADKHSSLTWWSGRPLTPGSKVDISRGTEQVVPGPGVAARTVCESKDSCAGVLAFRPGARPWFYSAPSLEVTPTPLLFLTPTALLIELEDADQKRSQLVITHVNGARADGLARPLPAMPKGFQVAAVTGVASDGHRFAIDLADNGNACSSFSFFCRKRAQAMVIDAGVNKVIFEQEISPAGSISALSPDGKHVAILDRNKLSIYGLP